MKEYAQRKLEYYGDNIKFLKCYKVTTIIIMVLMGIGLFFSLFNIRAIDANFAISVATFALAFLSIFSFNLINKFSFFLAIIFTSVFTIKNLYASISLVIGALKMNRLDVAGDAMSQGVALANNTIATSFTGVSIVVSIAILLISVLLILPTIQMIKHRKLYFTLLKDLSTNSNNYEVGAEDIKTENILQEYFDEQRIIELQTISNTDNNIQNTVQGFELFDDICNNSILSYNYEESLCIIDKSFNVASLKCGEDIKFMQEPDNEYDSKAVAVYFGELKIGYVFKGMIQDMINDWIKRADYFRGYINKIFIEENKATYKIGFYKPLSKCESKIVSLTKTAKKLDEYYSRSDNLTRCQDGEYVTLEYNYGTETYVVFNDCYEEIGEISKSNSETIYEKERNGINFTATIGEVHYDDNYKPKSNITIYFAK